VCQASKDVASSLIAQADLAALYGNSKGLPDATQLRWAGGRLAHHYLTGSLKTKPHQEISIDFCNYGAIGGALPRLIYHFDPRWIAGFDSA